MITAKNLINLLEGYHSSYTIRGKYIEVWTNPTRSDRRKLGDDIRFIADPHKKIIYAWDADLAVHSMMLRRLDLVRNLDLFCGDAFFLGDNYKMNGSDLSGKVYIKDEWDNLQEVLDQNWDWLEKYFSGVNKYLFQIAAEDFI